MVKTLTDLLNGTKNTEKIYLESIQDYIKVRYLSIAELNRIEKIEAKAMGTFTTTQTAGQRGRRQIPGQTQSNAKINMIKQTEATQEAQFLMVALACSYDDEHQYTPEEIEENPFLQGKVFRELYEKIRDMNNTEDLEEEVDEFPQDE